MPKGRWRRSALRLGDGDRWPHESGSQRPNRMRWRRRFKEHERSGVIGGTIDLHRNIREKTAVTVSSCQGGIAQVNRELSSRPESDQRPQWPKTICGRGSKHRFGREVQRFVGQRSQDPGFVGNPHAHSSAVAGTWAGVKDHRGAEGYRYASHFNSSPAAPLSTPQGS
jgi:hypothetical protein